MNSVPEGHTIYGDINTDKYVVVGPRATHAECALEICPRLQGSLACVAPGAENRFVGYGWIGLYQDPAAAASTAGWGAWAGAGCASHGLHPEHGMWSDGEPNWRGGSPERCAFGTFHQKSGAVSEADNEFGGGIFSAPCWSKMPCICEYGKTTTAEYSSAADALIAEAEGWRAWQKDNKNLVAFSLLVACVAGCGCVLGALVYFHRRLLAETDEVAERNQLAYADEAPAALEAKTNEVPQKKADEARVTTADETPAAPEPQTPDAPPQGPAEQSPAVSTEASARSVRGVLVPEDGDARIEEVQAGPIQSSVVNW